MGRRVGEQIGAVRLSLSACLALGLLVGAFVFCGGCAKSLFSDDDERSQFDRYRVSRDRDPTPYLEDEFGRRQPNLRGRLLAGD